MERSLMRHVIAIIALVALVQGCTAQPPQRSAFRLSDFWSSTLKELPYDSPPQIIYRIDDHRFVTLEHYRDCYHGDSYYNDTRAGIRKYLGRGMFENFQGRIVNADLSGTNIVLPLAYPPRAFCGNGEKGCAVPFWYSTDGGKTFATKVYMDHSFNAFEDSKKYTVVVTSDSVFISQRISETVDAFDTDRYPLVPGFVYGTGQLPPGKRIEFDAKIPRNLRTPSGQDRITCDASIKPTNPDAPLVPR
ncbi:hypothetical protein [Burkholderia territorii]|uniref:T6SS immunity protein Tli3 family protein n=1 Tax=Burkholderia territorii TaxID=1503055 RepID=UPI0007525865|nr:hypothetical protein WT49_24845 [Burkholderia territorii]KWE37022.1 hypothetical protein WT50_21810 [Burkholderia territorii]KWE44356.1 hypothetical protein WT51_20540 [Burkholderia territorii]